jgi:plastocyanin
MRRALIVAALLAVPAPAAAQMHGDHGAAPSTAVSVQFAAFGPAVSDVLVGDKITWTNTSVRKHDVAAVDASFNSGPLFPRGMYEHAFTHAGVVAYLCTLHPFMRGTIAVHDLLLDAPKESGAPGRPFAVHGRAALPAGTPVSIELDDGAGFQEIARTAAEEDGTFTATLRPAAPGRLRAVAAGVEASPPVALTVLDRTVTAGVHGGRVHAMVAPASPGATVVLQYFLRERFGWWPVRAHTLDHHSMTSFRVRPRRAVRARVVLTLADGVTPLAVSPTLRLRRARSHGH